MRDYDELVNLLKICPDYCNGCTNCPHKHDLGCRTTMMGEAADAIEELAGFIQEAERDRDEYRERLDKANDAVEELRKLGWIRVESRLMTEEERKERSEHIAFDIEDEDAIIYTSKLPDDGQEVLVCNKWGRVWIDTFSDDPDYGVGFEENGDMDGIVAWMPKPKPYEPPKEG